MKFKINDYQYQSDAVESVIGVFNGQPQITDDDYNRDLGRIDKSSKQLFDDTYNLGYKNAEIRLTDAEILKNIHEMQKANGIPLSKNLCSQKKLGRVSLDVEMETGTGKTFVYIKTMYELYRRYGWCKFMVVVPSIAIREGVKKSFDMLGDYFMEKYGFRTRHFVYSSDNLTALDSYSMNDGINVMIINVQAFNASFRTNKRGEGTNKTSRIIFSERDDFQSRRPIDVIAANNPVIIMDEPQKMEGKKTMEALTLFEPLFMVNYSATHRTKHNCVYALDALDAYQQKLVKKIQVKGITVLNLQGSLPYVYFDSIRLSKDKAPEVFLEIEMRGAKSNRHVTRRFSQGDNLLDASNGLNVYSGYSISEIDAYTNTVSFTNGVRLHIGEVQGDVSEETMQRVQIRETIKSHFEKERELFRRGIKTLSLFFLDKVANYKSYDDETGDEVHGRLWKVFEEEYNFYLNENLSLFEDDYQRYLRRFDASQVHSGYFSIDKKGRAVDSSVKRGESFSDDVSAYELILKNKERLLNFAEPVRFIFSHSALREGWDNPNVFQICTLRHASSAIAKRQEVGRGLRICVDQNGVRQDANLLNGSVHDVNKLTVIANESYSDFVKGLQDETHDALRDRPKVADKAYYLGRIVEDADGNKHEIDDMEAVSIVAWLFNNDYIDKEGHVSESFRKDRENDELVPIGKKLQPIVGGVVKLTAGLYDPSELDGMFEDVNKDATPVLNRLNKNKDRKEFLELWNRINKKYVYVVNYDSDKLIENAVISINANLNVTKLRIKIVSGEQGESMDIDSNVRTLSEGVDRDASSTVSYDLVGKIASGAHITRRSAAAILKGLKKTTLLKFVDNPEEFIRNVVRIIESEKAQLFVESISYEPTDDRYDMDIFTRENLKLPVDRAVPGKKNIMDYLLVDSNSESDFVKDLEEASDVCVYARLPRSFSVPTPVGNYAPDWAVAFNDGGGRKHIYFVVETKGTVDADINMQLRKVEEVKIECMRNLYRHNVDDVDYHVVATYGDLLNKIS